MKEDCVDIPYLSETEDICKATFTDFKNIYLHPRYQAFKESEQEI